MNNTPCYNVLTPKFKRDVFRDVLKEIGDALFCLEHDIGDQIWEHSRFLIDKQERYLETLKERIDDIVIDIEAEIANGC